MAVSSQRLPAANRRSKFGLIRSDLQSRCSNRSNLRIPFTQTPRSPTPSMAAPKSTHKKIFLGQARASSSRSMWWSSGRRCSGTLLPCRFARRRGSNRSPENKLRREERSCAGILRPAPTARELGERSAAWRRHWSAAEGMRLPAWGRPGAAPEQTLVLPLRPSCRRDTWDPDLRIRLGDAEWTQAFRVGEGDTAGGCGSWEWIRWSEGWQKRKKKTTTGKAEKTLKKSIP